MLIAPPKPVEVADPAGRRESSDSVPQPADGLSDGELLRTFLAKKEEAAFEQLVSRFGPLVFAVALRCLRDRHAAEDVFQATFLVLARDARKIRSPESIGSWLHGTALRISKRALARRRDEVSLEMVMHSSMPIAEDELLLDEISDRFQQQLVDEELQRLPVAYRAPLVLHFLEGKSCEETAAALGTTVGAVRGRLQRGKQELRFRLMKRGIEFSAVMGAMMIWQSLAQAAVRTPLVSAAAQGGMAIAQGTPFAPGCSPEAVHLAAQETAMLTTTKMLVSSAVLLTSAAAGWFAHAAVGSPAPSTEHFPPLTTTLSNDLTKAVESDDPTMFAFADEPADGKRQLILKYDDGKADGKKSIAGTGEMIRFTLPDKSQKLRNLRVHCARYGTPQPPDEDAEITIVSDDGSDVIHTEFVPYSTFQRGDSRWTTIRLEEEIAVPETFWVILNFNAEQTKGVYLSYDTSTEGKYSKTGLPGSESKDVNTGGDWMVQAILSKPE